LGRKDRRKAVFSFVLSGFHVKTAVYIDGYNLYYGRLRNTDFKWLDVVRLAADVLNNQNPETSVESVKYFTAPALSRFSSHGQTSVIAQEHYHRALLALNTQLQIIYGTHSFDEGGTLLPECVKGKPYDKARRVRVWKLEEKKTDVNLAIEMYRDAVSREFTQLVLISNDSDAEPVLRAIKKDIPEITIGVITPIAPRPDDGKGYRSISTSLSNFADWTRKYLLDEELARAQLPARVGTRKKPVDKPGHW
jgi:uncharacterized LabA/DUF88 family protein